MDPAKAVLTTKYQNSSAPIKETPGFLCSQASSVFASCLLGLASSTEDNNFFVKIGVAAATYGLTSIAQKALCPASPASPASPAPQNNAPSNVPTLKEEKLLPLNTNPEVSTPPLSNISKAPSPKEVPQSNKDILLPTTEQPKDRFQNIESSFEKALDLSGL
jgi:hypothetical protein